MLTTANPQTAEQEALLTGRPGLARLTGLSLRTISRLNSAGKLPRPLRVGGSIRWRVDEVRAWISAGCPIRRDWECHPSNQWKTPDGATRRASR